MTSGGFSWGRIGVMTFLASYSWIYASSHASSVGFSFIGFDEIGVSLDTSNLYWYSGASTIPMQNWVAANEDSYGTRDLMNCSADSRETDSPTLTFENTWYRLSNPSSVIP